VRSQVSSGRHCDGLVITGHYGDDNYDVIGEGKAVGGIKLNVIKKLLDEPKNQDWNKGIKAVYFDGAFTGNVQDATTQKGGALFGMFPNAQFIGSLGYRPRSNMPKESPIRKQMVQAFLKASAGGNIGTEQEMLQSVYKQELKGPGESNDVRESNSQSDKPDDPSLQPSAVQPEVQHTSGATLIPGDH
jgi:hypothetical protein